MSQTLEINIEEQVLKPYQKLINDKSRYVCLLGSRGSGKSLAASQIIVLRMLMHKFFRGVGIRKVYNTIEDSIFSTLLDVIEMWELNSFFEIKKSPFKITCNLTGNTFIFRGLDEPRKLKSLREASFVFFEEEVTDTYEEFQTIDLSIRTKQADFIQIMFAMNPVLEGVPSEHWFYKFMQYDKNTKLTFTDTISGMVKDRDVKYDIKSIHTTYKDNPFLPDEYVLKLENEKDPYLYAVNTLGIWCQKQIDDRFYKSFSMEYNLCDDEYDKQKDLYISCDFNLYPFSAIAVFQKNGKRLYQIDEICVNDEKESSIKVAAREFAKRYKGHFLNVYLCGDATGKKEDAGKEKGYNYYTIIY
jgi:PBSX family phage terminase large subunit